MGIKGLTSDHHQYEVFAEGLVPAGGKPKPKHLRGKRHWGWDCFTCDYERTGFRTYHEADQDCLGFHDMKSQEQLEMFDA